MYPSELHKTRDGSQRHRKGDYQIASSTTRCHLLSAAKASPSKGSHAYTSQAILGRYPEVC